MQLDLEKFVSGVQDYIARALNPLHKRLADLEARQPEKGEKGEAGIRGERGESGPAGRDGIDGKSVTADDLRPVVSDLVAKAVADIPKPKDGRDGRDGKDGRDGERGERGEPGLNGKDGKDGINGKDGANGLDGEKGEKGDPGINGKDGANGLDGKDGKDGINGKDGANGLDGKSVTIEDVRPMLDAEIAKWALDFERRAQDVLSKAIEAIPAPKDGRDGIDGKDGSPGMNGKDGSNGIDGKDGLGFDDLDFEYDGARSVTVKASRGDKVKVKTFTLPVMLYQGVHKHGMKADKGDVVTYAGSLWIAKRATTAAPGNGSADWQLAVKRGKDGKDAEPVSGS
jgi:hypothetical protein